ncbi:hypothetical protein BGX29_009990 [Mortierella sp. GBA35]|nr:hypothetical protein BGX29_009990 [Mortierella sp. GBA35]
MRSFIKAASLVAVVALAILVPSTEAGEEIRSVLKTHQNTGGYDPLKTLAVGPYPTIAEAASLPEGSSLLEKRAGQTCDPGFSLCTAAGGYCCPTGSLCSRESRLCCDKSRPFTCGFGARCCPYASCDASGQCGCAPGSTRCGNSCCERGCDKTGQYCKCDLDTPVDCGGQFCCSIGASCSAGNICSSGATPSSGGSDTPTTTSRGGSSFTLPPIVGGSGNAGSVNHASTSFAAVMAAAAIVFGA